MMTMVTVPRPIAERIPSTVYMVRPGPVEELRYSLRSLAVNVTHDDIWIIGAAPSWVNRDPATGGVRVVERPRAGSKYATTTAHIRTMCATDEISDPFVLWMDDVYAVRPVGDIPPMHLGALDRRLERFANLRSSWAHGMRATADLLADLLPDQAAAGELLSYETHAPLIVHKHHMTAALDYADQLTAAGITAPHKRTLYGNLADLGGFELTQDPKWVAWSVDPPPGPWLSSDDASFKTLTRPVLRWLFPRPCPYESTPPATTTPGRRPQAGNRPPVPQNPPVTRPQRPRGRRAVPSQVGAAERATGRNRGGQLRS